MLRELRVIQRLVLDEIARDPLHDGPVGVERPRGPLLGGLDDLARLGVDALQRSRSDAAQLLQRRAEEDLGALLADRDRAERGHAEGRDHRAGQLRRGVKVVVDGRGDLAERDPLGGGAGHRDLELTLEVAAAQDRAVAVEQQGGGAAEPAPAGDDRDLVHLRAVAVRGGDDRVRGLVHGDRLQLVGAEHVRVVARAADQCAGSPRRGRACRSRCGPRAR